MDVPPPQELTQPLQVPSKTLMGPGPSNCSPRVMEAISRPILGHMHPEIFKIMDDIKAGIRYVFQTSNPLTLAVSASGHGGMEAVLCNLLEPGDTALIAVNGIWGERAASMAGRYGAKVTTVEAEVGHDFTLAQIENAVSKHRPHVLFVTQGESSSGVYQNIEGIGDICHRYGCLLAVDTVASLGGVPFLADRWGVDAVYTGTQKVLGAPAGLAPISFSPRAQRKIFERKSPVKVLYWDMTVLGDYWDCFGRSRVYHHTIASQLLYGLREGLAQIAEEGLESVNRRHQECAQRFYRGLERLRLQPFVTDTYKRLPTVTSIKVPDGVDWREVVAYAMKNYSVEISGGLGPSANKVFRVGLMGYNATPEKVDLVLEVLEKALKASGWNRSKL
ncbi:alanine--glyoxylate aminotransferase [Tribolium castaneum]|uniref:Alanine--glyoxylate aminotransferase n=1 Tax=Tribolium castaneum TaxID=7070 RepID=D6WZD5_TRICA|nr:PREDICTED: serine--pyruvate aminotransferase, mitochondrial [Tribolium castaneum]EFA09724.1 Serine--pyruvate aminotransferase, mitochondrial-like Protein [Tribolium castaneum]|eukprot:XP_008198190.1 PREDICTED: serine--pyruvate aminotransferase, mitochondrial [Tribolium castaneum]